MTLTTTAIKNTSFTSYEPIHGLLESLRDDPFPTELSSWKDKPLKLKHSATHFGFVYSGNPILSYGGNQYRLSPGMYFSAPEKATIEAGSGIVMSRLGFNGLFSIGGAIEASGRLKYIDGCTDSCLIQPIRMGDPCLNALYFPPNIDQTQHTHPSLRIGMIVQGVGVCITPQGIIPLIPGVIFIIHTDGLHSFRTGSESGMTVIAYHPESDFGATDENHPMINRTLVNGVSAAQIDEIRTK